MPVLLHCETNVHPAITRMNKGRTALYCLYVQYADRVIERRSAMFKTGTWVGAARWSNQHAHPDHWHRPIRGQVLDFCDVRAWANSIHFPEDVPNAGAVMGVALKLR